MPPQPLPNRGLSIAEPEYLPLKAHQGGGYYWDVEAQQVIRSVLGEFLPPLEQQRQDGQRVGRFHLDDGDGEVLCNSRQVGPGNRVPSRQLKLLRKQLDLLQQKADFPETTPNNRWIIRQFKLPDFERDPELYRLSGPFWNRRLHVLWGCERVLETSLPPAAALPKLPVDSVAKSWPAAAALAALGLFVALLLLLPLAMHRSATHAERQPPLGEPAGVAPSTTAMTSGKVASSATGESSDSETSAAEGKGTGSLAPKSDAPASGSGDAQNPSCPNPRDAQTASHPPGNTNGSAVPKVPSLAQEASPDDNTTARKDEFAIQKQAERRLPDGSMEVRLVVWDTSGQRKTIQVDFWQVDGVSGPGGQEFTSKLTHGRHLVKARARKSTSAPVEISATVTVSTAVSVTTERADSTHLQP